ncbi:Uncharacterised protein [Mycobacterium tuberculosis]|nr:Uncharacterised protein [Mycobacterium tuberculosis]
MPSVATGVFTVTPAVWLICPPTKRITLLETVATILPVPALGS